MAAFLFLAVATLLLIALLIRRGVRLSARDSLSIYLNRTLEGRTEEAYHLLSALDQQELTLQEYRDRRSLGSGLVAQLLARDISFAIERMDIRDDRATAAVAVTAPDFRRILGDAFQAMATEKIPERNLEAFIFLCRTVSRYLDKYPRDALPMNTGMETFLLIREKGGWKVRLEK